MSRRKFVYRGFVKVAQVESSAGAREVVVSSDSVAILIYIPDMESVVLVSQERAPMQSAKNPLGVVMEVPAGRFDKHLSVKALMALEVLEETGLKIKPRQIELLNDGCALALSPGILTERMYLGYAEIAADNIAQSGQVFGNAKEGERTTRCLVRVQELRSMVFLDMKPWALVQWFLREKVGKGEGS